MRLRFVTIGFLLALAGPARADLSYTFLEVNGFYGSSFIDVSVPGQQNISFDNAGIDVEGSLEVYKYLHLLASYSWSETVSDKRILGVTDFDATTEFVSAGGGFHFRLLGDRASTFFDFQAILGDEEIKIDGLGLKFDDSQWGFLARAGIRWMPEWRWANDRLELFTNMQTSSQKLIDNVISFDVGGRYDVTEWLALGLNLNVGTDSFVGVTGGLRLYWWQLVNQIRGRDPNENLPWFKDASTAPGGYSGGI